MAMGKGLLTAKHLILLSYANTCNVRKKEIENGKVLLMLGDVKGGSNGS
jgi:hypothetical protein